MKKTPKCIDGVIIEISAGIGNDGIMDIYIHRPAGPDGNPIKCKEKVISQRERVRLDGISSSNINAKDKQ